MLRRSVQSELVKFDNIYPLQVLNLFDLIFAAQCLYAESDQATFTHSLYNFNGELNAIEDQRDMGPQNM